MIFGVKERSKGGLTLLKISGGFVWANLSYLIKTVPLILISALCVLPADNFLFFHNAVG